MRCSFEAIPKELEEASVIDGCSTFSCVAHSNARRERGIAVPQDVAIVGLDNWDVMTLAARPQLSGVWIRCSSRALREK
jgi:DNA-binding LacI/PurR family transcriptional regulator